MPRANSLLWATYAFHTRTYTYTHTLSLSLSLALFLHISIRSEVCGLCALTTQDGHSITQERLRAATNPNSNQKRGRLHSVHEDKTLDSDDSEDRSSSDDPNDPHIPKNTQQKNRKGKKKENKTAHKAHKGGKSKSKSKSKSKDNDDDNDDESKSFSTSSNIDSDGDNDESGDDAMLKMSMHERLSVATDGDQSDHGTFIERQSDQHSDQLAQIMKDMENDDNESAAEEDAMQEELVKMRKHEMRQLVRIMSIVCLSLVSFCVVYVTVDMCVCVCRNERPRVVKCFEAKMIASGQTKN